MQQAQGTAVSLLPALSHDLIAFPFPLLMPASKLPQEQRAHQEITRVPHPFRRGDKVIFKELGTGISEL